METTHPPEANDQVDAEAEGRAERAQLLDAGHGKPGYWAILHEFVARQKIVPGEEMAQQLDHPTDLVWRRRVILQVLPWNVGAHPFMFGTAMITILPDAPLLVSTESLHSGETIDDPALVQQYRASYDLLRAAASPPEASLAMVREVAEEHRHGSQPRWPQHHAA